MGIMDSDQADRAQRRAKKRELAQKSQSIVSKPSNKPGELTVTQLRAAKLMGRGHTLPQTARLLADWIVPYEQDKKQKAKKARSRLRRWVRRPAFRDAIYEEAVIKLDYRIPEIMGGVVQKAMAGRVDAARLVLEITGRHSPHTEIQPAAVNVIFGDVPRPAPKQIGDGEVVDMDAEIEDGDEDDSS